MRGLVWLAMAGAVMACSIDQNLFSEDGGSNLTGGGASGGSTGNAGNGGMTSANGGMTSANGGNGGTAGNNNCSPPCSGLEVCDEGDCVHACYPACEKLVGCVNSQCDAADFDEAECVLDCTADPDEYQPLAILDATCAQIYAGICEEDFDFASTCQCGAGAPGTTNAGSPCTESSQCQATNLALTPACFPEAGGWPGGYCVFYDCASSAACGPGNWCVDNGQDTICYDGCSQGNPTACRVGYDCTALVGGTSSICFPE